MEWCFLKPCWNEQLGMEAVSSGSKILSRVLAMFDRRDIGRNEELRFGGLLGFSRGMMDDSFQRFGMVFLFMALLKMAVRCWMASGPRCLRW